MADLFVPSKKPSTYSSPYYPHRYPSASLSPSGGRRMSSAWCSSSTLVMEKEQSIETSRMSSGGSSSESMKDFVWMGPISEEFHASTEEEANDAMIYSSTDDHDHDEPDDSEHYILSPDRWLSNETISMAGSPPLTFDPTPSLLRNAVPPSSCMERSPISPHKRLLSSSSLSKVKLSKRLGPSLLRDLHALRRTAHPKSKKERSREIVECFSRMDSFERIQGCKRVIKTRPHLSKNQKIDC